MQRLELVYQRQNPRDQFLTFEIANLSQGRGPTKVKVAIGVASGTRQWTFLRDFN
jgi:hypothetical protein